MRLSLGSHIAKVPDPQSAVLEATANRPVLWPLVIFGLHLAVPLALIVGCERAGASGRERAVLVFSSVWLLIGAVLLLLSIRRRRLLPGLREMLLCFFTILVCFGCAELLFRIALRSRILPRNEFLYPPGAQYVFITDEKDTPGIHGNSRFTINEIGLRGPTVPKDPGVYRIIAVGGSTTESANLDDDKQWTALLMSSINRSSKRTAWVANAGVAGLTTVDHLKLIRTLPSVKTAQMLIFLVGINDLERALRAHGNSTDESLRRGADQFFDSFFLLGNLCQPEAFFERSIVYQLALRPFRSYIQGPWSFLDRHGVLVPFRRARAQAKKVAGPDLHVALAEYQERIRSISLECTQRGFRCLFLTQPTMWRPNLSPQEESLLWFGSLGDGLFVSSADLSQDMQLYNEGLLAVCRERGLECYDLASVVPKDQTALFDDCHFTEEGGRIVADALGRYLVSKAPLLQASIQRTAPGAGPGVHPNP